MTVEYCMPVVPSADLERSLRFWIEGLGLSADSTGPRAISMR